MNQKRNESSENLYLNIRNHKKKQGENLLNRLHKKLVGKKVAKLSPKGQHAGSIKNNQSC